jgi:hypothetical protein
MKMLGELEARIANVAKLLNASCAADDNEQVTHKGETLSLCCKLCATERYVVFMFIFERYCSDNITEKQYILGLRVWRF